MGNLQWTTFPNQGRQGWMNVSGPKITFSSNPRKYWDSVGMVCSATESHGGVVSALNGYDRAIISLGCLQWAGAIPGSPLMSLLTAFWNTDKDLLLKCLEPAFKATPGSALTTINGICYFTLNDKNVTTVQDWCNLIQEGVSGLTGSWTDSAKLTAKTWAECLINAAEQPSFILIQAKFFESQLESTYFVHCVFTVTDSITKAKVKIEPAKIFDYNKDTIDAQEPYKKALIAAFVSYAANIPLYALEHLYEEVVVNSDKSWKDKFNLFCNACRNSTIKEWPGRWKVIAPVLQSEFGVDISLSAKTVPEVIQPIMVAPPPNPVILPEPVPKTELVVADTSKGALAFIMMIINFIMTLLGKVKK